MTVSLSTAYCRILVYVLAACALLQTSSLLQAGDAGAVELKRRISIRLIKQELERITGTRVELVNLLRRLKPEERDEFLNGLSDEELTLLVNEVKLVQDIEGKAAQASEPPPSVMPSHASGMDSVALYDRVVPSVVVLETIRTNGEAMLGSGFLLDPQGVLVTNAHVIRDAGVILVKVSSENKVVINTFLACDPSRDIAILPIPEKFQHLPRLQLRSKLPQVGEPICALGAPKGFDYTLTSGVVSQIRRNFRTYGTMVQIDARVAQGNSGGPLLDASGCVAGVVTLQFSSAKGVATVDLCVSSLEVEAVLLDLQERHLSQLPPFPARDEEKKEGEPADAKPLTPEEKHRRERNIVFQQRADAMLTHVRTNKRARARWQSLRPGMSYEDVINLLGEPTRSSQQALSVVFIYEYEAATTGGSILRRQGSITLDRKGAIKSWREPDWMNLIF